MNMTATINKLSPIQQLYAAIFLITLGISTGVTYSDHTQPVYISEEFKEFDVFSYQADYVVIPLMNSAFENPSKTNLRNVSNELILMEYRWLDRTEGDNREAFTDYLNACQVVISHMQEGTLKQSDLDKMNELYNKLN